MKQGVLIKHLKKSRLSSYSVNISKLDNVKSRNIVKVQLEDLTKVPTVIFGNNNSKEDIDNIDNLENTTEVVNTIVKKIKEDNRKNFPSNDSQNLSLKTREFSFELVIREKLDHGLKELGSISMAATDQNTMKELSNQLIDRI